MKTIFEYSFKKNIFRFSYFGHDVTSQKNCSQIIFQNLVFFFWDTVRYSLHLFRSVTGRSDVFIAFDFCLSFNQNAGLCVFFCSVNLSR